MQKVVKTSFFIALFSLGAALQAQAFSRIVNATGPHGGTVSRSGSCGGGSCSWGGTATGPRGNSYSRSGTATRTRGVYGYRHYAPPYAYAYAYRYPGYYGPAPYVYPRYAFAPYAYRQSVVYTGNGTAAINRTVTGPYGNSVTRSTTIYR